MHIKNIMILFKQKFFQIIF